MYANTLYKDILLEHYRHPRNKVNRTLDEADRVRRGANPRCGDEIEVGLCLHGTNLSQVLFRGRGCSVCIASASIMTGVMQGKSMAEARALCRALQQWFGQQDDTGAPELPDQVQALAAVRDHPARYRCVLLSWEAMADALEDAENN